MAVSRISELASLIKASTADIEHRLTTKGQPSPSFSPYQPIDTTHDGDIAKPRQAVLEATDELHCLMLGPVGILTSPSHNFLISLQAIYRFDLATSFPAGKNEATFAEIAGASGLHESHVRRILRHAMAYRIFCEPLKGIVAHTAASKLLADNLLMREWVGMVSEEMWPAATRTVEAITKWPKSEEPNHSGFNIAHDTDKTVFNELSKHPARQKRYAAAMTWFSTGPGLESHHVVEGFSWDSLGSGTVVDVGGSHGSVSIAISEKFPSLHCIVQDQAEVVKTAQAQLATKLKDRVAFMEHDFFTEQPVQGADAYLLRWILHDWSDRYAVRILRALIPALKPSSKIVICEHVLPEPGSVSSYHEKMIRGFDLAMLEFHNAKERDIDDWTKLLAMADKRFHLRNVRKPVESRLAVMEIGWVVTDVEETTAHLPQCEALT